MKPQPYMNPAYSPGSLNPGAASPVLLSPRRFGKTAAAQQAQGWFDEVPVYEITDYDEAAERERHRRERLAHTRLTAHANTAAALYLADPDTCIDLLVDYMFPGDEDYEYDYCDVTWGLRFHRYLTEQTPATIEIFRRLVEDADDYLNWYDYSRLLHLARLTVGAV